MLIFGTQDEFGSPRPSSRCSNPELKRLRSISQNTDDRSVVTEPEHKLSARRQLLENKKLDRVSLRRDAWKPLSDRTDHSLVVSAIKHELEALVPTEATS